MKKNGSQNERKQWGGGKSRGRIKTLSALISLFRDDTVISNYFQILNIACIPEMNFLFQIRKRETNEILFPQKDFFL